MAGSEQRPVARAAAAGSGSRFAVTCGLLRQYMKEHGGSNGGGRLLPAVTAMSLATGADAAVGAAAAEEVEAPEERKTMELFPQQAGTLKDSQERKETEKAQLTIFYGGSVVVFDDFPAEKVDELMKLAGSCDTAAVSDAGAAAACELSPGQPCLPDMPIARKVSLQRFLEKRKNRLTATEPLPAASPPESEKKEESSKRAKKDDGASWLEVNPTLSL
ncbi:hypothetical protein E2562_009485 [Oryza meyeriana var. granulata]|uniref:Protein TIFY n=1 Tax=Oryza meyeriana var. granulata TaxID=110450 RepID=A0A6G1BTJ3_9ORYZ|nr:hypothetical protein E2562_009485 [Oryza meyeriana var. granulata]